MNLIPLVHRWLLPASQRELGRKQLPEAQQDVPQRWDAHHRTSSAKQPEMPPPSVPALAGVLLHPTAPPKGAKALCQFGMLNEGGGFVTHRQLQLHHLPSVTRGDKGRKSEHSETPACQLFVTRHGFIPFAHPQPKHPFAPASRTLSAQQTAFAVQVTTGSKPFFPPVCH